MGAFTHLVNKHPCFGKDAHLKYGRIHLPVSPECNIQCKFCKRGFNKYEERPGVSRALLKPEDSVELVKKALDICPEITVVGIAGPGDTLATSHALETFEKINKEFPHLINCLSTNGLVLYDNAERIANAGVKTITVTVNSIDPNIQKDIVSYIKRGNERITGIDAADFLISSQLKGIKEISKLGVAVKINTVLIPGINDKGIEDIARKTSQLVASIYNVIPLIPQNDFLFRRAPNCDELNKAREDAEKYIEVFRHCKHCRADACGIPGKGKDLASLLYDLPIAETFSHG